ncbi:MAG: Nramp family divalent metal transporter [Planctomycetes bacterium]|nr:Nramp family divalent metal transporter [Planctomycetota bacterium]
MPSEPPLEPGGARDAGGAPRGAPGAGSAFEPWEPAELPEPPALRVRGLAALIGPGLLMAGANIGGGEWLFGPLVTAQYGGAVLWLATLSILSQVFYNLAVMRYPLFCGETIFVGFLRCRPGPLFWVAVYLLLDLGNYLPYLAANAAVPIATLILGRLPTASPDDAALVKTLSYGVYGLAFVPLIFGGKVYDSLERVMLAKLVFVLGYLSVAVLFLVSWGTKGEILSGFLRVGEVPEGASWATLAAFAAYAGAGGLTNTAFSNYARDKGWGMGAAVGAIPSAVGGRTIQLSHSGKTFPLDAAGLRRWRGWMRHILRDQCLLWAPACLVGMALPSMLSYEFIRGVKGVEGNAAAAMTAEAVGARHGAVFWLLTLLCGFAVLFPTQISNLDSMSRRWTDVIWLGVRPLRRLEGNKVKLVYYGLLASYAVWGFVALNLTPNPLVLAVLTGVLMNFGMAFSALHVLYVNLRLLPPEVRPGWALRLGLVGSSVFYTGISAAILAQKWPEIRAVAARVLGL